MINYKKLYVFFTGILGVSINLFYSCIFFIKFKSGLIPYTEKEILISALSLEISWVFIFIWFIQDPFKKRGILIISLIPMIISNLMITVNSDFLPALINIFVLLIFCLVFTAGYFFADEFKGFY